MHYLCMTATASACLGIMPGVTCASLHATVGGIWLALFASTQGMAAQLSRIPEALRRPAPDLGQRSEEILTSMPMEGLPEMPSKTLDRCMQSGRSRCTLRGWLK